MHARYYRHHRFTTTTTTTTTATTTTTTTTITITIIFFTINITITITITASTSTTNNNNNNNNNNNDNNTIVGDLKRERYQGCIQTFKQLYEEGGVRRLFSGCFWRTLNIVATVYIANECTRILPNIIFNRSSSSSSSSS